MKKLFNKLLVPIDFSSRSLKAVEKAAEIAAEYDCSITLIHVVRVHPFSSIEAVDGQQAVPFHMIENRNEIEFKLMKYEDHIQSKQEKKIETTLVILKGSWDEAIIDYVNNTGIDLIVIGQKGISWRKRNMLLNPDKIASHTNVPVITMPVNKRIRKLSSIVIPVTDFLPIRKIMYGIYIASKSNASLKLLLIEDAANRDKYHHYLNKAYELIQSNCTIKTEIETIACKNAAEAVSQYAMLKSPDLVIVNPGTQTRLPGLFSSLMGNIIQKYAAPPVLTVTPL